MRTNVARRLHPVALFELGPVVQRPAESAATLPDEKVRIGVLIGGTTNNGLATIAPALTAISRFFGVEDRLELGEFDTELTGWPQLHPSRRSQLRVEGRLVGVVGELHPRQIPEELEHLVEGRFGYLELDFEPLVELATPIRQIKVPSSYTASSLDLSFGIDRSVSVDSLLRLIRDAAGVLCVDLAIFDRYEPADDSEHLYLGVRLRLESDDGVVDEASIQALIEMIDQRSGEIGAHLRRG